MTGPAVSPFRADAVDANQAGHLTDAQRQDLGRAAGAWRHNELVGAGLSAVVGLVLITATGPARDAVLRPIAGIGLFALAAFFLVRSLPGRDALTQDVRSGVVQSVDGALEKRSASSGGRSNTTFYYLTVGSHRFEVSWAIYQAAPEAGVVRVFYLPRSHRVVNLEQLADRPLPPGALDSPMQAMASMAAGLRSHDSTQRAEAMATMAAMEHAVQAEGARNAVPPPPGQRDPRPLAEAILGSWRTGPMTVTFEADGSATATGLGSAQHGPWSVDRDGRLHFDVAGGGHEQVAEAWVAGDTLTIAEGGEGRAFRRVAGA